MLTLSTTAPCLQLCNIVANKNVHGNGRRDDSNSCGVLRNWHSYSLSPPKKTSRAINVGLPLPNGLLNILFRLKATKFSCFLWSFLLFSRLLWGRVTSNVCHFCYKLPSGYTKVGFCYSETEKSPVNRLKIRACSKSRRFCGDNVLRNRR